MSRLYPPTPACMLAAFTAELPAEGCGPTRSSRLRHPARSATDSRAVNTPTIGARGRPRRRLAAALRASACCAFALLPLARSAAMSIGPVQGSPLLGRTLQVAVPVALNPGEQLACVRGELQQRETAPAALAMRIEPAGEGRALLRLSSTALVVEPIVTVKVVVGCQDQLTHSHVMLADPPPAAQVLPVLPVAPVAAAAPAEPLRAASGPHPAAAPAAESAPRPVTQTRPARAAPPQGARAVRKPAAARRAETRVRPKPARAAIEARATRPAAAEAIAKIAPQGARPGSASTAADPKPLARAEGAGAAKPRLMVEPVEDATEAAPALKPSAETTPADVSAMTRPEAAAARAGLAAALDPQAAAAREAAVQAELRQLREQLQRQAGQLQRLDEQRELERNIAAALAAALALALGALLWRRSGAPGSPRRWWQADRPSAPATSALPSSLFPSWAPDSAAADSAAAVAAQPIAEPAQERTQVMNAAELAAAIPSLAPAAPSQPAPAGDADHPDLDLDFSSLHGDLEAPAATADAAAPQAAGPMGAPRAAEPLADASTPAPAGEPQPAPAPHEIDWEAPVVPATAAPEPAAGPVAAPEAPMLPELDFGGFDAGSVALATPAAQAAAPSHEPSPAPADDNGLDFDLDIDLPGDDADDARMKAPPQA